MSFWTALFEPETHHHHATAFAYPDGVMSSPESGGDMGQRSAWDIGSRLTISFAPDGTPVSKYQSELYQTFSHLLSSEDLENTIVDAFQTWARESNLNIGVVQDDGSAFGSGGPTQGDDRFGDIRIGTAPMAEDVFAISVSHDELISGSWAGDVLFNSNATFQSVDQIYATILHEAGHVFGLDHSDNVDSVMHPFAGVTALHAEDTAHLQEIYGARMLDQFEEGDGNNVFDDAARIKNSGSLHGEIPLVVYGDIDGSQDKDFYFLQKLSNYIGPISFRLVSEGISVLTPSLTVFDEDGNQLAHVDGTGTRGVDISATIPNANESELFVRVESAAATGGHSVGSYSLIATFDNNVIYDPQWLEHVIVQHYQFVDQQDVQKLFLDPPTAFFADDLHTNDTIGTATPLETTLGFAENSHYRQQASISDATDVDFYQFTAPDFDPSGLGVLNVNLASLTPGGLIPTAEVYDAQNSLLDHQVLVNGNGEFVLQVENIEANQDYFVNVVANRPGDRFDVGNYDLRLSFAESAVVLDNIGAGKLDLGGDENHHTLYVAETQLFHFALTLKPSERNKDSLLWMTVYDEIGEVVYRVVTTPGETRTAKSVVLRPGSYSVQINSAIPEQSPYSFVSRKGPLIYSIDGTSVSDPTGPEIIDPSDRPFPKCGPNNRLYCYPNGHQSPNEYLLIDGRFVNTPRAPDNPPHIDPNAWYWYVDWLINDVPDDL